MIPLTKLLHIAVIHEICLPLEINGIRNYWIRLEFSPVCNSAYESTPFNHFWNFFLGTLPWQHDCLAFTALKHAAWLDIVIFFSLQHKILLFVILIRNRITSHRFPSWVLLFKWRHQILSKCLISLTRKKIIQSHSQINSIPWYYSSVRPLRSSNPITIFKIFVSLNYYWYRTE